MDSSCHRGVRRARRVTIRREHVTEDFGRVLGTLLSFGKGLMKGQSHTLTLPFPSRCSQTRPSGRRAESRRAAFFRESMEEGSVGSIAQPRLDPRVPVMDTSGADPTTSRQMGLLVEDTTTGDRRTCPMT